MNTESAIFSVGELTATIVASTMSTGHHCAGYNGIWQLQQRSSSRNLFVPDFAGWNLEHIFDGHTNGSPEVFYELRSVAMYFRRRS